MLGQSNVAAGRTGHVRRKRLRHGSSCNSQRTLVFSGSIPERS
jgi:hypothetical protein